MKLPFRITMVVVIAVVTYCFVYGFVFFLPWLMFPGRFRWIRIGGSVICAIALGSLFWTHTSAKSHIIEGLPKSMGIGALVIGMIGFMAALVSPIFLGPQASQAPLLGIFVTGPLGALGGALGGATYWAIKKCKLVFSR